jgi:hypothetical protein
MGGSGSLAVSRATPAIKPAVALTGAGVLSLLTSVAMTSPQVLYGYPSSLEFRVTKYTTARTTPTVYDEVLNGPLAGSWLDELVGPGSGTLTLSTQHPKVLADPTLLAQRNWITALRDGQVVGRFILQTKELVLAGSNGDMADRLWTISGEGLRTLLHDAVVFPENGQVGKTTGTTRYFNFATVMKSRWYNSSQWVAPHSGPNYLAKNSYFLKYPAGYPIAQGQWIWGSTRDANGHAAVGYNYFRCEFTATVSDSSQTYSFYAAGDDALNLYLDGIPIANTAVGQKSWANVVAVEGISLTQGAHVLSAQVYNAQGRAGFMACVRQDANDSTSTAIKTLSYTGDSHWKVNAYPSQEPGWTIGEVLLQLWGEAQTRGVDFPAQLRPTFSENTDSAGVAWPSTGSYSFPLNTDYSDMLAQMEAMGCEAWVDPSTLTFNVYVVKGIDYSVVASYPNPPTLQIGQNLTATDETSTAALKNGLLVQAADGWTYQTDSNSLSTFGRIEGGTQVSVNLNQASTIISKTFSLMSTPQVSTTYQIIDTGNIKPGIDFTLGDWIMAPAMNVDPNTLARRRVMSITYALDTSNNNPNVVYAVELDTVYQDHITTLTNLISKLNNQDTVTGAKTSKAVPSTGAGAPIGAGSSPATRSALYAPTSFAVGTITGTYDSNGNPTCALALSWVCPVDDEGNDQDVAHYEIYGSTPTVAWALLSRVDGANLTTTLNVTPVQSWTLGVRAVAAWDAGLLSDFSNMVTVTSIKPGTALDPPTAPTLATDKGTITAHWDGKLINSGGVSYTPPVQFKNVSCYIYTNSPSESDIHQVAGLLQGAGAVVISGLAVGTLYYVVFFANDNGGLSSAQSAPASVTVIGITGPDILANSITANQLAVGAITADKLDVGTVPQGNQYNRVPNPLSNTAYWSLVVSSTNAFNLGGSANATALAAVGAVPAGLALLPTPTAAAYCYVANKSVVPLSGSVYITMDSQANLAYPVVTEYDSTGTGVDYPIASNTQGTRYKFNATAVAYAVKVSSPAASSPVQDIVTFITVFETVGSGDGLNSWAELSPDGLRLYSGENQNPTIVLSASANDLLSLSDSAGDQIATIDIAGNASFQNVSMLAGSTIDGAELVLDPTDEDFPSTLSESTPNGNGWTRGDVTLADGSGGTVALLDRLGRGVIYDVTWPSQEGRTISTQYARIAQDSFTLEDGRSYLFILELAGLQLQNSSGVNIYVELQMKVGAPNTSITDGQTVGRAVIHNGDSGYWSIPPIVYSASNNSTAIDTANRVIPAGTPIYWQVNTNLSAAPTPYTLAEFGFSRGFTVVDVGSVYPTHPLNGTDALADVHDYSTSGGSSGGTSGGTPASSKTVTGTATWSRTWNNSGSNIVSGSGQYTNSNALYQGNGVTAMGGEFGFSSSFLSQFAGKTVTSASVYLKNAYQAYSGKSALMGTSNHTSAPSTISGRGSNTFSRGFSAGEGQWIPLSGAIRDGLSSGSVSAFRVGVDGSDSNYMYFEGVGYGSHPPQLKVTFY